MKERKPNKCKDCATYYIIRLDNSILLKSISLDFNEFKQIAVQKLRGFADAFSLQRIHHCTYSVTVQMLGMKRLERNLHLKGSWKTGSYTKGEKRLIPRTWKGKSAKFWDFAWTIMEIESQGMILLTYWPLRISQQWLCMQIRTKQGWTNWQTFIPVWTKFIWASPNYRYRHLNWHFSYFSHATSSIQLSKNDLWSISHLF